MVADGAFPDHHWARAIGYERRSKIACCAKPRVRSGDPGLDSRFAVRLWRLQSRRMALVDFGHSFWRGLVLFGSLVRRFVRSLLEGHRLVCSCCPAIRCLYRRLQLLDSWLWRSISSWRSAPCEHGDDGGLRHRLSRPYSRD